MRSCWGRARVDLLRRGGRLRTHLILTECAIASCLHTREILLIIWRMVLKMWMIRKVTIHLVRSSKTSHMKNWRTTKRTSSKDTHVSTTSSKELPFYFIQQAFWSRMIAWTLTHHTWMLLLETRMTVHPIHTAWIALTLILWLSELSWSTKEFILYLIYEILHFILLRVHGVCLLLWYNWWCLRIVWLIVFLSTLILSRFCVLHELVHDLLSFRFHHRKWRLLIGLMRQLNALIWFILITRRSFIKIWIIFSLLS